MDSAFNNNVSHTEYLGRAISTVCSAALEKWFLQLRVLWFTVAIQGVIELFADTDTHNTLF